MTARSVDLGDLEISRLSLTEVRHHLEWLTVERLLIGLPPRMEMSYEALCLREATLIESG